MSNLEEKYLQASTELGKTKEYEWKVKSGFTEEAEKKARKKIKLFSQF